MLKKIIIIAAVICIPVVFYLASIYGQFETVTFQGAITAATSSIEGEQSPKVIVVTEILSKNGHEIRGRDSELTEFRVDYTGSEPLDNFEIGEKVRFVGHVHGVTEPYLHAMQVYEE